MDSDTSETRKTRRNSGVQMSDPEEHLEFSGLLDHELFNTVYEGYGEVENYEDYEYLSEDEWVDEDDFDIDAFFAGPTNGERKKRNSYPPTNTFHEQLQVKKLRQPKGKHYNVVYKCKESSARSLSKRPQATRKKTKRSLKDLLARFEKIRIHTSKESTHAKKLTQEELLEEAKITEIENLKSLERYKNMDIEKKIKRLQEHQRSGHTITFHSRSISMIEEVNPSNECFTDVMKQVPVVSLKSETPTSTPRTSSQKNQQVQKCERTLITFTDENLFNNMFPPKRSTTVKKKIVCPISGEMCKYKDPLTKIPFGNVAAFRVLREDYHQQIERNGYYAGPQVPQWIEFFQIQEYEQNCINIASDISLESSK